VAAVPGSFAPAARSALPGLKEEREMADRWTHFGQQSGPVCAAGRGVVLTPSDSVDVVNTTIALWVGGAGAVNVDLADGGTVLISGIPAGTLLPIRVKRLRATSTTATLIVGLD
jgi:hypothetical protein